MSITLINIKEKIFFVCVLSRRFLSLTFCEHNYG